MKKSIQYICLFLLCTAVFSACNKKYDTISTVKTVPSIIINGSKFITLRVGENYTEADAKFVDEGGQAVNIAPDSDAVDIRTPGLYVLSYSRNTASRFSAADYRYVAVTNIADSIDLSGVYLREATGTETNIEKVSRGLYSSDNFGGSSTEITVYFAQTGDSAIAVPEQPTSSGVTSATDVKLSFAGGDTTLSYRVINASFGSGVRTFVKQ